MRQERDIEHGSVVFLATVPPELLAGLPVEDQRAIRDAVGTEVKLVAFDEDGRTELEFTDSRGVIHFIYVNPEHIQSRAK